MRVRLPLVFLCLFSFRIEASARFSRRCDVYMQPSFRSDRLCEKVAGAPILKVKGGKGGFLQVETTDCDGFVAMNCVTASEDAPKRAQSPRGGRERASEMDLGSRDATSYRIGASLSGGGLWGKPASAASSTSGSALSGGLQSTVIFGGVAHATLTLSYQILSLSRTVDATGSIIDTTPAEFTQKTRFLGVDLGGGIGLGRSEGVLTAWWFDGGIEFLSPISATQTDNFGSEVEFSSSDKLLLAHAGPSGDFLIARDLFLTGSLQFFYNLGSKDGNSLLGARLIVSFGFGV